jgi:hypothetical protein
MPAKRSDAVSVAAAMKRLQMLGCPSVRQCEGDPVMRQLVASGSFKRTPDLVAGPIVGGGLATDFYIDVQELYGELLFNPNAAGGSSPPLFITAPHQSTGELRADDLPKSHFGGYASPIEKKLHKYSAERNGSPLVGLVVHLDLSHLVDGGEAGPEDLRKWATQLDYVRFLNDYFDLAEHNDKFYPAMTNFLVDPEITSLLFLRFRPERRLTFLCFSLQRPWGGNLSALMLVNERVLDDMPDLRSHPVVEWLWQWREKSENDDRTPSRSPQETKRDNHGL